MNGVVYERFKIGSKEWNERVAKSKFASLANFGKAGRRHLCPQDHGAQVAFRSIKVWGLPGDGAKIPFAADVAVVQAVPAFPNATWEGRSPESAASTSVVPRRPLVVTHAGDQPYWNHNGGSIAFGPDGCLYWGLGDGGSRDDPLGNGQRLDTLLGNILRIDVVTKGGNYGWSLREGTRPFGNRPEANATPIDPVWEYDHQVGKNITGGFVYRGRNVPAPVGSYHYGDYVSGWLRPLRRTRRARSPR